MGKSDKKPKATKQPSIGKVPRVVVDPNDFHKLNPAWRISRMLMVDPYGWHVLNAEQLAYIQEKLSHFESMTWSEILINSKKFNHLVEVGKLCTKARNQLLDASIYVDEVLSLRLSSTERVWGILDRGIVELLWWDPNHEICPSSLRNT